MSDAGPLAEPNSVRQGGPVIGVAFSPDSQNLATASVDGRVRLWNIAGSAPTSPSSAQQGHASYAQSLAFSADGRWLVSGDWHGTALLWDLAADPRAPAAVLDGHRGMIRDLAISPDGRWVVTGARDNKAVLWDTHAPNRSTPAAVLPFGEFVFAVAFSPDGRWMAAGSWDQTTKLVDLTRPQEPPLVLNGQGRVLALDFSADSAWLATAGEDHTARLWDLGAVNPAAAPVVLQGQRGVYDGALAMSADTDGRWLVTGHHDGKARLWRLRVEDLIDLACRTAGRNLRDDEWRELTGEPDAPETCPNLP
jgi:WD40 repeat protein